MESLRMIEQWPVDHAAAAVVRADGTVLGAYGPQQRPFPLASVTKLLVAYAVLVGYEEGAYELDDPAGPDGSTVRHLLAHTSGLAFGEHRVMAAPGTRRIYSSAGFEVLADTVAKATGMPFAEYLDQAVLQPLRMTSTSLPGGPGAGGVSTLHDLTAFAAEVQAPRLLHPTTVAAATQEVAFPGLRGVLPGYGMQPANDWGLGFEIRGTKSPHWTSPHSSPSTFGHFGQSGTFLWFDPAVSAACAVLTDHPFGPWSLDCWPPLTSAILAELSA